jgi:hypothetical protein
MSAIYVDGFLMAAVEDQNGELLEKTGWATLHAIHSIFLPQTPKEPPGTTDPISKKKL